MTAMWFGLAAIALIGAIVLLYFDRLQRQRTGHVRQVWAKSQGYTYVSVEPSLASTWRRGAMAKLGYLSAVDVVSGNRRGEKFVLFDLEDAATLVAVRRHIGSDIDIDLRLKTAAPPKDADLELLGAIGDRVVFATNPDIARHAVDQRMVAFIETLPETVQQLWSEGNWSLGMLPVGTSSKDWEAAIDAVLRLSGLLHVLPPVAGEKGRAESDDAEPSRPRGRSNPAPESDEIPSRPSGAARVLPPKSAPEPDDDEDSNYRYEYRDEDAEDYTPLVKDIAGETDPEPPRRPALAVVPDPRNRVRRNWPPAEELPEDGDDSAADEFEDSFVEDELPDRPGGPFHPGFRPYQGPAPR
ncbi:hypothetical protein NDR87_27860 [Nocardia sp. CDC159]|uniref:Secreted protein n=2 Tax=Nocardiaceae TaxID=85025 RepID=A0A9X2IZA7_9NOCA|nr:hypothetical protein [Nocardia pulmonis]MCM6790193.1 hypothetical protein [Nocardia sp. CDC159]